MITYFKNIKTVSEIKSILKLAGPIIVAQVFFMGIEITDCIMAGLLGELELACVSTAGSFVLPVLLFVIGIKMVLSPIVSTHLGKEEYKEMGTQLHHMCIVGLAFSLPILIILLNSSFFLTLFGVNPVLIPGASLYLTYRSWGIVPIFLFGAYRYYFEGIGITKPIMWTLFLALGLNILFNWLFIFGVGPFPVLGVAGIGAATAVTDFILCFSLMYFEKKLISPTIPKLKIWYPVEKKRILSMLKLGIPSGFLLAIEVLSFTIVGILLAKTTIDEVASHQIVLNISALTFMIPLGISGAMSSRIGYLLGSQNRDALKRCINIGLFLTLGFMVAASLIILVFRDVIGIIYHASPEVLVKTSGLFLIVAAYQIVDGLQVVFNGMLKGFKNTFFPLCAGLVSFWGLGFIPGYILANYYELGVFGYWSGFLSGLSFAAVFFGWRLRRYYSEI
jgi:multidrug resistance protein, MATE family